MTDPANSTQPNNPPYSKPAPAASAPLGQAVPAAPAEPVSAQVGASRRGLVGLVAGAAVLAGVGVAWWRNAGDAVLAGTPAPEGFWTTQWPTPQGPVLAMQSLKGRPLLLNFWATWCPPCIEELPLIDAFYMKNKDKGWQVLGLAVDKLQPVQGFLQKTPVQFPIGMAGLAGTELSRSFGNFAGGLPFTVVLGRDGSVLHRKMGQVHAQELDTWSRLK